jgi:hypothetical protein
MNKDTDKIERFDVEYTDTFGGEANYCWVKRETIEVSRGAKRPTIVRAAKLALGLTGVRCRVTDFGDMIEIRPRDYCTVAFVSWHDASLDTPEGAPDKPEVLR